jgi:hypothetical protein
VFQTSFLFKNGQNPAEVQGIFRKVWYNAVMDPPGPKMDMTRRDDMKLSGQFARSAAAVLMAATVFCALPAEPAYAKSLATHYTRDTKGRFTRISRGVYERNPVSRRYAADDGTFVLTEGQAVQGGTLSRAVTGAQGLVNLEESYPEQESWNLYLYDPSDDGDAWLFRAAWAPDGSSDSTGGNGVNRELQTGAESFPVRVRKDALVHYEFYEDGKLLRTDLHFLDYARIRRWKVDEAGNLTYQLYDQGQLREHFRILHPVQNADGSVTELSASNRDQNHQ